MLNPNYNQSFFYFDGNGMILERTGWDGDDDGKGDSVGRNAFAYICWPDKEYLKESILSCIKVRDDSYLQFYRYPGLGANTMSRDHVGGIILAFYINRDWKEFNCILDNLPWRLSRKHTQTVDFWLWHKALRHKSFWLAQVFYLLILLMFILVIPWNFLIRTILGIKKVDLDSNPSYLVLKKGSWKWYLNKTIYPQFAFFLLVWQIHVLPGSWFKSILQRMLLLESGNVVLDHLLGKELTAERYDTYKPTLPFIWSGRMDNSTDVIVRRMTEQESKYNDINQGMLDYLYYGIDKIMLNFKSEITNAIKNGETIIKY